MLFVCKLVPDISTSVHLKYLALKLCNKHSEKIQQKQGVRQYTVLMQVSPTMNHGLKKIFLNGRQSHDDTNFER